MKNKSIYDWYKKLNKVISSNVEKITLCNFSIEVKFSHHKIFDNIVNAIHIDVYNHKDSKCEIIFHDEIATYYIDKVNKQTLSKFKKFLENLSENVQNS